MPAHASPGQVAYEAFMATHAHVPYAHWRQLSTATRQYWEAAAQAVREMALPGDITCPVCGTRDVASTRPVGLTADGEVHRDMSCEDCAATWTNVYTFAGVRYVERTEPRA